MNAPNVRPYLVTIENGGRATVARILASNEAAARNAAVSAGQRVLCVRPDRADRGRP
jgi:hypothetical protein